MSLEKSGVNSILQQQYVWSYIFQGDSVHSKGEELRLHAPLDKINLHVREGSVIPTQVKKILGSIYIDFFFLSLNSLTYRPLYEFGLPQTKVDKRERNVVKSLVFQPNMWRRIVDDAL